MITIVNYGAGNLFSIQNMLKKLGSDSIIASDAGSIEKADKLLLPGVGAFDTCAQKLRDSGLMDIVCQKVIEEKIPVLGICVGMQLMMSGSEEGILPGLGWLKGTVVKFRQSSLKIPHMGWSEIEINKPSRLFTDMYDEPRYYFVHSYHAVMENEQDVLAYAEYGNRFVASVERENILGVQFHPEKSHKYGMKLLENFAKYY